MKPPRPILTFAAAAAACIFAPLNIHAQVPAQPLTYDEAVQKFGDGLKDNMVIRGVHYEKTDSRKDHRFYTDLQDLSDVPAYHPRQQVSGTLRISGTYLVQGTVADQWKKDFAKFQPNVTIVATEAGTVAAGTTDIETGPRVNDRLNSAADYEAKKHQRVFEIDWASGSYDVPGWSPAFVIFVQKDNPITHLTMEQLDGIFAGARSGGWQGTTWHPEAARGPEKNIRTWGQLGLTGEWANKPIDVYGRPLRYNIQLGFERKVFHGGDVWNENTREYAHEMNPDGTRYTSSIEMVKDLGKDKYGICFSDMGSLTPDVKAVPVGRSSAGPFIPITLQTMRDRSYPLYIEEWAEISLPPNKPLDPIAKEFLTFMLSREGQDAIQRDGKWIPIPGPTARRQIAKLDQLGEPVKPAEVGLQSPFMSPTQWAGDSPDETRKVDPTKPFYTQHWDLSDLPSYTPTVKVSGKIRLPLSGLVMQSTMGKSWMEGFAKYHPGVTFEPRDGELIDRQVDVQLGRRWSMYFAGEYAQYQLKYRRSPKEIQIATGSFDVPGWSPAFAIFVNKDNPLKGLTLRQLDDIFSGPRRGGWVATAFHREVGRGPAENIRTWGQLGLTGPWKSKPIDVVIPPLKYYIMSVFERKVFAGSNMWNDSVKEVPVTLAANGAYTGGFADRIKRVGLDRDAITFGSMNFATPSTRALPLAAREGGPFVALTLDNVRTRKYPLYLELYAYADQEPNKPLDATVKEFLRYILSREGQEIVQRDGKWLPLTAAVVQQQLEKLNTLVPPVDVPPPGKKAAR
jgi:ABC-type phosphate transport system substrate-binding protein